MVNCFVCLDSNNSIVQYNYSTDIEFLNINIQDVIKLIYTMKYNSGVARWASKSQGGPLLRVNQELLYLHHASEHRGICTW